MELGLSEQEHKELLKKYDELLNVSKPFIDSEDKKQILKAFNLASEAHKGMRRRSGEPYIYHPVEVAKICAGEIGLGATSIVCALLHDVVEDTDYTIDDMRVIFGDKVASIIDGLTKMSGIVDSTATPSMQAENFKKMLITLADDVRVILIKLADRLHNMRTLEHMPAEKRLKIASETSYMYAPLAHRLGLYAIKSELEDLALKYTEPDVYNDIANKIENSEKARSEFIARFVEPIKNGLDDKGLKYTITGRTKSINSIRNKIVRKKIIFEEVFDVFAIRIILDSVRENETNDCWSAYSAITNIYKPNPDRLRDWISTPKANGYEALHTTVMSKEGKWVEVQIRSKRMNEIAEKGYAAHWKYKENKDGIENSIDDWLSRIKELLQRPEANALDFMDEFKLTLFTDEIFVFTPKGEMKDIPKNSTALDFAYYIHTDLGNKCIGAKVNHKLVPLSHILKSGDQIEILSSDKQNPKEEWLQYVITAKAKLQIKNAIKEEQKKQIERGKQVLERMFSQVKTKIEKDTMDNFAKYIGIENKNQIYIEAAKGNIQIKTIKAFTTTRDRSGWLNYLRKPFIKHKNSPQDEKTDKKQSDISKLKTIELDTNSNIVYKIADCCNPVLGDDVLGYVMSSTSLEIHRTNCPTAIRLNSQYGDRIKKVKWNSSNKITFKTGIQLFGIDKHGIIRDISKIVSEELHLNISSFNIESHDGAFECKIQLYVNDTENLKNLINTLKKIEGVEKVHRIQ